MVVLLINPVWNGYQHFIFEYNMYEGIDADLATLYVQGIMGLLPDTQNCGLRLRLECRERFSTPPTSKETAS